MHPNVPGRNITRKGWFSGALVRTKVMGDRNTYTGSSRCMGYTAVPSGTGSIPAGSVYHILHC